MDLPSGTNEMIIELNKVLQPYLLDNYRVFAYDWSEGWVWFKDTDQPKVVKKQKHYSDISRWGLKQPLSKPEDKLVLVLDDVEWIPITIKDPTMEFYALQLYLI